MHELALAQNILKTALAELKQYPGVRLKKIRIVVGQQHAIVPENMHWAYAALIADTPAAGSTLDIKIRPLAARCRSCGWQGALPPHQYLCGRCGAVDVELNGGDELYLESLEVETNESNKD